MHQKRNFHECTWLSMFFLVLLYTIALPVTHANDVTSSFQITGAEVEEDDRVAIVTVELTPAPLEPASVIVKTNIDSAFPYSDYRPLTQRLNFQPGETTKDVKVFIFTDTEFEPIPENINMTLSANSANTEISVGSANVTINDSDLPELTIGEIPAIVQTYLETDVFDNPVSVRLSRPSLQPVTFRVSTVAGSAKGGEDYFGFSRQVTLQPGETIIGIPIQFIVDDIEEGGEYFHVRIYNASGAVITRSNTYIFLVDS